MEEYLPKIKKPTKLWAEYEVEIEDLAGKKPTTLNERLRVTWMVRKKEMFSVTGKGSSKAVLTSKTLQVTMSDSTSQSCFWAVKSGKVSSI